MNGPPPTFLEIDMSENLKKPSTLKDLLAGGHISLGAVEKVARQLFDGKTTAAVDGIDGYIVTACSYDDLPDGVRSFLRKAILEFGVENILDVMDENEEEMHARADEEAEAARAETGLEQGDFGDE